MSGRLAFTCLAALLGAPSAALADSGGVSGMSGKPPPSSCTNCHSAGGTAAPKLMLTGPTEVPSGETAHFKLAVSGLAAGAGFDIAASDGTLAPVDRMTTQLRGEDLSHTASWPHGQSVNIDFDFVAPAQPGMVTLFFTVLSVDGTGGTSGDATASSTRELTIGPPPDLAGVDLAGADFALAQVDLATTPPPPKTFKDEARWSCAITPHRDGGDAWPAWTVLAGGVLALLLRRVRRPRVRDVGAQHRV
jgi:hypothetical protein